MQKVKVHDKRNWQENPHSGVLTNKIGLSDIGANFSNFEDKFLELKVNHVQQF